MSIKLRTTIVTTREDWSVARIEVLGDFLREQKGGLGTALFAVAAGDREPLESADPFLSIVHSDEFDAMWLAAIDTGADLRLSSEVIQRSPTRRRVVELHRLVQDGGLGAVADMAASHES